MIAVERITGLVLAGGRGTRMGSVDKGLQVFRGEPLVAHVLRRIEPQAGTILISANRHRERYEALGHVVVADVADGHAGPLAGLHAGLTACRTDFLFVVPCDAPLVPHDLVSRLVEAFDDEIALVVARTDNHLHPVFSLMRRTVLPDLAAYLASGNRAVRRWIERLPHREVSFDDERAFVNLNTLEELHAIENDSSAAS